MGIMREWWKKIYSVAILLLYLFIVLSTLHVAGKGWNAAVQVIGPRFYSIADLIIIVVLATLFINLIYTDLFRGKAKSLLRYVWLIAIGWAALATIYKIDDPQSRMHMPEYLMIGFLTFYAAYSYVRTRTAYVLMIFAIIAFAVAEEYLQLSIPNRSFSFGDLFIDIWSATLAIMIIDFAISPEYSESMTSKALKRFFGVHGDDIMTNIKYFCYEFAEKVGNFFTR